MVISLELKSTEHFQMIDILDQVKAVVSQTGILNGLIFVSIPHTTAALTLNNNFNVAIPKDMSETLKTLIPEDGEYEHIEGNSAAHILASLIGNTVTIILNDGHFELGMFQTIFFCEFHGPRKRNVLVKVISD